MRALLFFPLLVLGLPFILIVFIGERGWWAWPACIAGAILAAAFGSPLTVMVVAAIYGLMLLYSLAGAGDDKFGVYFRRALACFALSLCIGIVTLAYRDGWQMQVSIERGSLTHHIDAREDAEIAGRALADHYECELVIDIPDEDGE